MRRWKTCPGASVKVGETPVAQRYATTTMTSPDACPLCGGPNACAVSAGGSTDAPCWCRSAVFSEELLARVPSAQRGLACICARCATASSLVSGDQPEAG
ncbi:cysteine-rich CWC family protein [Aquabacterium sp.]|uniref:cysteine-rich CWC family protein n=1 Tax=Aquabacterium sp. TaxID=1872578 RepID=UPI003D6D13FF